MCGTVLRAGDSVTTQALPLRSCGHVNRHQGTGCRNKAQRLPRPAAHASDRKRHFHKGLQSRAPGRPLRPLIRSPSRLRTPLTEVWVTPRPGALKQEGGSPTDSSLLPLTSKSFPTQQGLARGHTKRTVA